VAGAASKGSAGVQAVRTTAESAGIEAGAWMALTDALQRYPSSNQPLRFEALAQTECRGELRVELHRLTGVVVRGLIRAREGMGLSPVLEDLRIVSVVNDRGREIVDGAAEVLQPGLREAPIIVEPVEVGD